jgi:hypothetical protein
MGSSARFDRSEMYTRTSIGLLGISCQRTSAGSCCQMVSVLSQLSPSRATRRGSSKNRRQHPSLRNRRPVQCRYTIGRAAPAPRLNAITVSGATDRARGGDRRYPRDGEHDHAPAHSGRRARCYPTATLRTTPGHSCRTPTSTHPRDPQTSQSTERVRVRERAEAPRMLLGARAGFERARVHRRWCPFHRGARASTIGSMRPARLPA